MKITDELMELGMDNDLLRKVALLVLKDRRDLLDELSSIDVDHSFIENEYLDIAVGINYFTKI